ncbi:MAG: TauD/TfdA family dioxygenase [Pseudomonadota bacterium]|nr:TauD/TfdA family dioxygenase [Pseudomonadota bacterium]
MAIQLRTPDDIDTVPLHDAIGTEVRGIDLTKPLEEPTKQMLRELIGEYSILLIRGQDISEEQQFAYARSFGPIAERMKPASAKQAAEQESKRSKHFDPNNKMQMISNKRDEDGKLIGALGDGEMWFHTDKCYLQKPYHVSFLYPTALPTTGGHTMFASLYRAYDLIPKKLKETLQGRKVLQVYDYGKEGKPDLATKSLDDVLHYWQPLFLKNPFSGKIAVYVSRLMSAKIEGMDDDESRRVLDDICDIIEDKSNFYEHTWKIGDIIGWDNYSTLHARTDWPRQQERTFRRCLTQGDRLY